MDIERNHFKSFKEQMKLDIYTFYNYQEGTFQSRHIQCGSRNFKIQWTLVKMNKSNKVQRNIEKCKFCPNVIFCWQPTAARKLWPEKYFNIHVAFVSFWNIPQTTLTAQAQAWWGGGRWCAEIKLVGNVHCTLNNIVVNLIKVCRIMRIVFINKLNRYHLST